MKDKPFITKSQLLYNQEFATFLVSLREAHEGKFKALRRIAEATLKTEIVGLLKLRDLQAHEVCLALEASGARLVGHTEMVHKTTMKWILGSFKNDEETPILSYPIVEGTRVIRMYTLKNPTPEL